MTLSKPADSGRAVVLDVRSLRKEFPVGNGTRVAIGEVSFTVSQGEFVCVVGPSGCGKTTLLRCLAGLAKPTSGEVIVQGQIIDRPPEHLGVVFQDYRASLMPWLTARGNVELPLLDWKLSRAERAEKVDKALEVVGLLDHREHHPWQMSGGMQQRVAIARALAYEPSVLLMDEPFASLDAQTRSDLEDVVLSVQREFGVTIVFITHDISEAIYLSDRVVVLTKSPSSVCGDVFVDLPRERDQWHTPESPAYLAARAQVYDLMTTKALRQE